jgi:hypothetical protein
MHRKKHKKQKISNLANITTDVEQNRQGARFTIKILDGAEQA